MAQGEDQIGAESSRGHVPTCHTSLRPGVGTGRVISGLLQMGGHQVANPQGDQGQAFPNVAAFPRATYPTEGGSAKRKASTDGLCAVRFPACCPED